MGMNPKAKRQKRARIQIEAPDKLKRRLRKASKARDKSMTDIVIDALERELEADALPIDLPHAGGEPTAMMKAEAEPWIRRNLGCLSDKVKPEDWKRDDRVGDMLRKYVPR